MSTTQTVSSPVAQIEEQESPAFASIGIEFEYPLADFDEDSDIPVPAARASRSRSVREHYGRSTGWLTNDADDENGYVGSDHVGAEITSGILSLHDGSPESWYRESIDVLENDGYPFAASGCGDTNFGLHMHISQLSEEQVEFIREISGEMWFRPFVCTSVDRDSADPWRHGGVRSPGGPRTMVEQSRGEPNHYEWRLPEPMAAEHFDMVMDFLRLVAHDKFEEAEAFARGRVYDKDERLTAVHQYQLLDNNIDAWPHDGALTDDQRTDPRAARWFHDLMQSD